MRSSLSVVMGRHKLTILRVRTFCSPVPNMPSSKHPSGTSLSSIDPWKEMLKAFGKNSVQRVSTTATHWWERYEEFVGLVEVREAQGNVAEAEKSFMVARAIVREVRDEVEAQQIKLKEVRDRLDRVSREDVNYLELATQEHKLLQEEKRIRAAYVNAEDAEREKFSLFSAAVRESHEKERTRAERTKNWSVIGSVLGAIIGVLGSTYINRVRLQELKSLLLEAQKGPISLQEAIQEQASTYQLQQKDLSNVILNLKNMMPVGTRTSQPINNGIPSTKEGTHLPIKTDPVLVILNEQVNYSKQTSTSLENLQKQFSTFGKSLDKMTSEVQNVKAVFESKPVERAMPISSLSEQGQDFSIQDVILELSDTKQRLQTQINRNSCYSTALTCAVFAFTVPALYILLKGN